MNVSNLFIFSPSQLASATALKVLANVDLSAGAASSINSGTLSDTNCKMLQVLATWGTRTNNSSIYLRFNASGGASYAWRASELSGFTTANAGGATQAYITQDGSIGEGSLQATINNATYSGNGIANVLTTPYVSGFNFNAAITSVQLHASAGNLPTSTKMVVLGV